MGPSISGIHGKSVRHVRYTTSQHYDTASRRPSRCSTCGSRDDALRYDRGDTLFRQRSADAGHPGLLLAFVLAPMVNLLRRAHLGRVPSVLLGVTLGLCVILAIGGVIGSQIAQLTTDIPQYATTVETKVSNVRNFTIGRLSELADQVGAKKNGKPSPSSDASSPASPQPAPANPPRPRRPGIRIIANRTCRTLSVPGAVALRDVWDRLHRRGLCPAAERGSAGPHDPSFGLK